MLKVLKNEKNRFKIEGGNKPLTTEDYINHPHDKIIRNVLQDKEEGAYFINKALNLKEEEKLTDKNIYNYN